MEYAKQQFGKRARVYSPYVLCRSLEVWSSLKAVILPNQMRQLIEATYFEREEQKTMQDYKEKLAKERKKLRQIALYGVSKTGSVNSDDNASTRYSEQDTVQVLLIKSREFNPEKNATIIHLLDENEKPLVLSHQFKKGDEQARRDIAIKLLQSTVQVAEYHAPKPILINDLKSWLGEYIYLGKSVTEGFSLLRVAIVDKSGEIKELGEALEKYQLKYDNRLGYQKL